MNRRLYHPCLQTFRLALPYTFRDVHRPTGTTVEVRILGDAGGVWRIQRSDSGWIWSGDDACNPEAIFSIEQVDAWKVFTKRRSPDEKRRQVPTISIQGDEELAAAVLGRVSVMA
jgi:hypothetical protein